MLAFLLKGIFLGFCTAAPVGPIGLICIRNSLRFGWRHGLLAGLGAACADAIYGAAAALGLGAVAFACPTVSLLSKYAGAAFLLYLGSKLLFQKTLHMSIATTRKPHLGTLFASTLALT